MDNFLHVNFVKNLMFLFLPISITINAKIILWNYCVSFWFKIRVYCC